MSFTSVMKAIGNDALKGLAFVAKYIIPVGSLVTLIFPPSTDVVASAETAVALIQKAVVAVEQKYAASGAASGTGAQKLSEVLLLTQDAVTSLLEQAGIKADTQYITNLVNAVVAILNVQLATTSNA